MARGSTSKVQKLRMLATSGTITLEIDGETKFITSLKAFTTAVEKLISKLSEGALISAELVEGASRKPIIRKHVKAVASNPIKAVRATKNTRALKIYVPRDVAGWLGAKPGDMLTLECLRIRGKPALLVRRHYKGDAE